MADGGKVYAFRTYYGRLSASTAVARGSGDTNRGNLLLNLVAKKSILGQCHLLHIEWKTSGMRNHSVWMVWPSLDSLSATMLSRPGMCWALESLVSWYTRSSGPDMSPSLFMYDTTVVLLVATSTTLFEQRSWNSF